MLNLPHVAFPLLQKPKLWEQIKVTKADKKLALAELMMVCHNHLCDTKLKPEKVKDFDVAGAIHDRLDVLVAQE